MLNKYIFKELLKLRIVTCSVKLLVWLALGQFLFACASSGVNSNLDTEVKGQNNRIIFSWSENHPFANEYKRGTMALIAEYIEEDLNGDGRSVRQVISNTGRDFNELNTKIFALPPSLRSIPKSTNICLYLALNNQAIPVRTNSNAPETARFSYKKWQQNVFSKTRSDFSKSVISQGEQQLRLAIESENLAKNAKFDELEQLNKLLEKENMADVNTITSVQDCDAIKIEPTKITKTKDIIEAEYTRTAATAICTKASFWMLDNYEIRQQAHLSKPNVYSNPATFKMAQVLPAMFAYNRLLKKTDLFQNEKFKDVQKIYGTFETFAKLTASYYANGTFYYPEGYEIVTSKYALEANQHAIFTSLIKGEIPQHASQADVQEVVFNEYVEVNNCIDDLTKHLNTKRQSYELNSLNAPKRAIASTRYFIKSCKAQFYKREQTNQKFMQQRIDAQQQLTQLKAQFQMENNSEVAPKTKEQLLNQNVCRVQ